MRRRLTFSRTVYECVGHAIRDVPPINDVDVLVDDQSDGCRLPVALLVAVRRQQQPTSEDDGDLCGGVNVLSVGGVDDEHGAFPLEVTHETVDRQTGSETAWRHDDRKRIQLPWRRRVVEAGRRDEYRRPVRLQTLDSQFKKNKKSRQLFIVDARSNECEIVKQHKAKPTAY